MTKRVIASIFMILALGGAVTGTVAHDADAKANSVANSV